MTIPKLRMIDISRTNQEVPVRSRSRGIPPALENNAIFSSNVIREAERGLEDLFGPHRLGVAGQAAANFSASFFAARFRDITFAYVDYRVPVEIKCQEECHDYSIFMPTNGTGTFVIDQSEYESSTVRAAIPRVNEAMVSRWQADSPHLIVKIARPLLERQLTRMVGRSLHAPIVFKPTMNLISEHSWRWHSALQLLHEEIYNHDAISRSGNGITSLEEFVAATLLLVQPCNYTELLYGTNKRPESRVLRKAMRYIESNLAEDISIASMSNELGVSIRTLQKAFRDELGTTPVTFIRDLRLERVHQALEDADIDDVVCISDLANRWGLTHYGRFAASYRVRFAESPSETLAK